jgi:predicted transposase/invertase (TIGR01784 family)
MMEWDIAVKTEAAEERGLKRGREEGLEEGLERGLEEGLERGLERGREEGLERGREESQRAIARSFLKLGRPIEEVAQATGLSVEAVQSLLQ